MKTPILILLVFCMTKVYTQNLILNGDFENFVDSMNTNIDNVPPWVMAWGTPDYFNYVIADSNGSVPSNVWGTQHPFSGKGFSGMTCYAIDTTYPTIYNVREFMIGKTQTPLVSGHQYCLTFYLSMADTFNCAINRIGVYFSPTPTNPSMSSPPYLTFYQPEVMADSNLIYNDKTNWINVTGSFTANGGEQYLTVGNLYLDDRTDTLVNGTLFSPYETWNQAYYYFDNFSLEEIKPVDAGPDTVFLTPGNSIMLGNDSDSASTYTWYPNVSIDDTSSVHPIVNPTSIITYYVQKKQCNVITTDSITVVVGPVGLNALRNDTKIGLYPNPNNGEFRIEFNLSPPTSSKLEIVDLTGKVIYDTTMPSMYNKETIKAEGIQSGFYFVIIKDSCGRLINCSKMSVAK
jgi:hypothetical protein